MNVYTLLYLHQQKQFSQSITDPLQIDTKHIEMMSSEISLNQVSKTAKDMMNGKTYGRVIINVNE